MTAPTMAILFNDRSGPAKAKEAITRDHAFVEYGEYETEDEEGTKAYLLTVGCETATPEELMSLFKDRLPDYIKARRFPPSRLP